MFLISPYSFSTGRRFSLDTAWMGKTIWDLDADGPLDITSSSYGSGSHTYYNATPLSDFTCKVECGGAGGGGANGSTSASGGGRSSFGATDVSRVLIGHGAQGGGANGVNGVGAAGEGGDLNESGADGTTSAGGSSPGGFSGSGGLHGNGSPAPGSGGGGGKATKNSYAISAAKIYEIEVGDGGLSGGVTASNGHPGRVKIT